MTAKEYLSSLKILKAEADRIAMEINETEKAREMVEASEVIDQATIKDLSNRVLNLYCRYVELKETYFSRYKDIMQKIIAVPLPIEKDVLYMRYVQGYSFRRISDHLAYAEKYITNVHGRALQTFSKIWKVDLDDVPLPPVTNVQQGTRTA